MKSRLKVLLKLCCDMAEIYENETDFDTKMYVDLLNDYEALRQDLMDVVQLISDPKVQAVLRDKYEEK